jgi:serralysin
MAVAPIFADIAGAQTPSVQNVVLIVLDDMNVWGTHDGRASDPYAGRVETPNLDAIARRGHTFINAFVAVPLCSPSRAAFLTGTTSFETRVFENHKISDEFALLNLQETLPAVMKEAGFNVGVFGKVYHRDLDPSVRGIVANEYARHESNLINEFGHLFGIGPLPIPEDRHVDYLNTTKAIDFIRRHKGERFFVALGINKPHDPYVVPQHYFDRYPLTSLPLPTIKAHDIDDLPPYIVRWTQWARNKYRKMVDVGYIPNLTQGYLAATTMADTMVGRLLQQLSLDGLNGNTAIVVVSDNGYHLGEKDYVFKLTLWDESARVPMMIVNPQQVGPRTVPYFVQIPDIYPTILDLAGVPIPDWVNATSLMPQLTSNPLPSNRPAITTMRDSILLRTTNYAYIRYGDGSEELYDMKADPRQWTNRAQDPLLAVTKPRLAAKAEAWARSHKLFFSHADGEVIVGTPGSDAFSGSRNVTLRGRAGDDTYFVHTEGVSIVEEPNEGIDTLFTDVSATLPPNVEHLVIVDQRNGRTVRGNDLDNEIMTVRSGSLVVYDGRGLDTIRLSDTTARIVLTAHDYQVDDISETFDGPAGWRIDLSEFGPDQTCAFNNRVLTVNGEQAALIRGKFNPAQHVVNGCTTIVPSVTTRAATAALASFDP